MSDFFKNLSLLPVILFWVAVLPPLGIYHDGYHDQKWILALIVLLAYFLFVIVNHSKWVPHQESLCACACVIAIYLIVYTVATCLADSLPLHGPFENPNALSLHLCLLLPFIHGGYQLFGKGARAVLAVAEVGVVVLILLCQCRCAVLCIGMFYAFTWLHGKWRWATLPIGVLATVLLALLVKQESSQGRLFILRNTLDLILQKPILGWGSHGFDQAYMPLQAAYFRFHPDSPLAMLADDIRHPLNEFLLAMVNHGVLGLAGIIVLFAYPLLWRRRLYNEYRQLWFSTVIILLFSLFCYPLLYPLPWIVLLFGWMYTGRIPEKVMQQRQVVHIATVVVLFAGFCLAIGTNYLLMEWGSISRSAKRGHSEAMMPRYASVYPYLSQYPIFLYDYCIESLYANRYDQAYHLAEECRHSYSSYDLSLLEGDICRYAKRYDKALSCYREASEMCPVRFAPLYGKWQVYKEIVDKERKDSVAQVIRQKEIKVYSPEITKIMEEINE